GEWSATPPRPSRAPPPRRCRVCRSPVPCSFSPRERCPAAGRDQESPPLKTERRERTGAGGHCSGTPITASGHQPAATVRPRGDAITEAEVDTSDLSNGREARSNRRRPYLPPSSAGRIWTSSVLQGRSSEVRLHPVQPLCV